MTREDGPKFSKKHGEDAQADPMAKDKIKSIAHNGEVACAGAFQAAEELKLSPAEIGKAIDLLDFKIVRCQLGLFGHTPVKKPLEPETPDRGLELAIREALVEKKLTCSDAWSIAGRLNVPKMKVSAACDALEIKIQPCQLGAF